MFCMDLGKNSKFCLTEHKLIGFYNRDEKCLQRGTDWDFKYSGLRLVCKGLSYIYIYIRTNSDLCDLQHKLIGFYNRDEKCLQRGTDWVFK